MMRGLHTPVRAIRRRVFKEVAQLGFKADEDTLLADMEAIPYAIVNEDSEKYRESGCVWRWDFPCVRKISRFI